MKASQNHGRRTSTGAEIMDRWTAARPATPGTVSF